MKKRLAFLPVAFMPFLLSSCLFFSESDEWKQRYGTPELLLENSKDEAYCYVGEEGTDFRDVNNVIREALKAAAPYANTNQGSSKAERFFAYEGMWMPATSGPNYNRLYVWDDGFVRIDHKSSLGPHVYLSFSISSSQATLLNDLAYSRIAKDIT